MPSRSHSKARTFRPEAESVPEILLADEQKELLAVVLSALSAGDREVLARLYLLEQGPEQICTDLGISETQLRLIKSRAKARLAELSRHAAPRKRGPGRAVATKAGSVDVGFNLDRAIPVMAHAVAVFGDEQKASHWFKTPLAILENRSPTQLLAGGDVGRIETLLTRIEHNIPS
jgi:uncharacterized protein (DUF2384 family)